MRHTDTAILEPPGRRCERRHIGQPRIGGDQMARTESTPGTKPRHALERILERSVHKDLGYLTPCRVFIGYLNPEGYGYVGVGSQVDGTATSRGCHVVAWEAEHGSVPKGLFLDHLCHNPETCDGGPDCPHRACNEPSHLRVVTNFENAQRSTSARVNRARHLARTHCIRGHEFAGENLRFDAIPGRQPARVCRTCKRETQYARRVAARDLSTTKSKEHHA